MPQRLAPILTSLRNRLQLVFFVITLLAIAALYMYVAPGLQNRLIHDRLNELALDARQYQLMVDSNMSRVNTRPGERASVERISNSTKVRPASLPPTRAVRLRKSIRNSPTVSDSSSFGECGALPISLRRNAALTRLENSRSENGLVM